MALLSDDIVVDDEWSIASTFPPKTVGQLEVIRELVLSKVKLSISWMTRSCFINKLNDRYVSTLEG